MNRQNNKCSRHDSAEALVFFEPFIRRGEMAAGNPDCFICYIYIPGRITPRALPELAK